MSGHGDYNRGDCFAPPVIRRTNDGDLQDAGVGCDNRLDFDRVDTFAATLDQIILAVDDIDIATCVAAAQITTIEPAIAYRRCGFRRPRPVTRGYLGSADYDFPDTIRHNIDAVVIDDPQVDHLNRFPADPSRQADCSSPSEPLPSAARIVAKPVHSVIAYTCDNTGPNASRQLSTNGRGVVAPP